MRNETRLKFDKFISRQAEINGIPTEVASSSKFNVDPSVSQTLEVKLRESHAFLDRISYQFPVEQTGEKLGLDTNNSIASTTDTTGAGRRETRDVSAMDSKGFHCQQINSDTHLRYKMLDAWAKFPDFQLKIQEVIIRQQAFDRMKIGFNGTSRAATSDLNANPLLQDVAVGWLQKLRDEKPSNVLSDGLTIGASGDYKNIDALVFDAHSELIAEWHQEAPGMVVICGRSLLTDKYVSLIDSNDAPTERNALESLMVNKALGGLPTLTVPYFPADSLCITSLDNLSIYVQDGSRRRHIKDVPEQDCIKDFQSANVDYIVEDTDKMCLVEKITVAQ